MSLPETSDSELVDRMNKRDPDGLAKAYDRYGPVAFGLFMRITRDRAVAEDLLQELFMRLWNRARDFDSSRGSLGVWIVSIARNMAIDHLRSAQSRFNTRLRPIENLDPLLFSRNSPQAESVLDRKRMVGTALASLNANERRALELAYFEGCSQTEIASRLNQPLGTVKTWIRTGLGRLRSALSQETAP